MKKIGLTGGIGSGKTTVSTVFSILGIPVYNADIRAKILMNSNPVIINKLKDLFGNSIYLNNILDRKKLASLIFNDKSKLKKVNNIVHPEVVKDFKEWCLKQNSDYILKEAAILFESKTYKDLDYIITVTAPEQIRIDRVMKRDRVSDIDVKQRINNQLPDYEKINKSNFVIYNDNVKLILPQILDIHKILSSI